MTISLDPRRPTPLSGWALVEEAVHAIASSDSHEMAGAAARTAVRLLHSAAGEPGHALPGHRSGSSEQLEVQVGIIGAVLASRTGAAVPLETRDNDDEPLDQHLHAVQAGAGDVLCLIRVCDPATRESVGAVEISAVVDRLRGSVRSDDVVVAIDGRNCLVVMRALPVPVVWRRMSGFVGDRRCFTSSARVMLRAGLADVGLAGPQDALRAARIALSQAVGGAGGPIAIARADDKH